MHYASINTSTSAVDCQENTRLRDDLWCVDWEVKLNTSAQLNAEDAEILDIVKLDSPARKSVITKPP